MENLLHIIEAMIFASDTPITAQKIKNILQEGTVPQIKKAVKQLNENYDKIDAAFHIVEVAEGFQMVSRADYASWLTRLYKARQASRLTRRALETLAIIAYKQPVTKTEMESIRGVNVDGVVKTLIERNLITVTGREKAPGNPLLYGTTKNFLEYFGLKSINDLPKLKEIDELLKSDEKFLENLDQVSLQQLRPEELGLTSMLNHENSGKESGQEDQTDRKNELREKSTGETEAEQTPPAEESQ